MKMFKDFPSCDFTQAFTISAMLSILGFEIIDDYVQLENFSEFVALYVFVSILCFSGVFLFFSYVLDPILDLSLKLFPPRNSPSR